MTDYASQGRTRPNNVVDLNNCHSHQSYYTCLSRSASTEGTVIVQGFDPKRITGGTSGFLRQEFRELEILDHISDLTYHGILPAHIEGHRRNTLVRSYQQWKADYCPEIVHPAIRWSVTEPLKLIDMTEDSEWMLIKPSRPKDILRPLTKQNQDIYAKEKSKDINKSNTTMLSPDPVIEFPPDNSQDLTLKPDPVGFIWKSNYSCAYDALLTILYNLWSDNREKWT
ncbi:hypothetical protein OE88DRAFT_1630103, partial [Heliocybe sulcata]